MPVKIPPGRANVAVPSAVTGRKSNPIRIESIDDPRVEVYANLKDAALSQRGGFFIAEGPLVVKQLLTSSHEVHSILTTHTKLDVLDDELQGHNRDIPVYTASQEVLDAIAGIHLHRGILACGVRPPPLSIADLIRRCRTLLILEDLSNHDNIGGLFRVAAALGGPSCGVILSPRCCDPYYRKALRVSIGHVLSTPFVFLDFTPELWKTLASAGFTIVSTQQTRNPLPVTMLDPPPRLALVLGAEGPGLQPQTAASIDAAGGINTRIPMTQGVDSLNIVVAAGILLSHLVDPALLSEKTC
jgi:tRNA G18 (ribose-2'-O)-methylase SpoU